MGQPHWSSATNPEPHKCVVKLNRNTLVVKASHVGGLQTAYIWGRLNLDSTYENVVDILLYALGEVNSFSRLPFVFHLVHSSSCRRRYRVTSPALRRHLVPRTEYSYAGEHLADLSGTPSRLYPSYLVRTSGLILPPQASETFSHTYLPGAW